MWNLSLSFARSADKVEGDLDHVEGDLDHVEGDLDHVEGDLAEETQGWWRDP